MRISDWSSDVCSSDLVLGKIVIGIAIAIRPDHPDFFGADAVAQLRQDAKLIADPVYPPIVINDGTAPSRWNHLIDRNILQWHEATSAIHLAPDPVEGRQDRPPHRVVRPELKRSEEHTSELQSLMRISYAVFCLKKKKTKTKRTHNYKQHTITHDQTTITTTTVNHNRHAINHSNKLE